MSATVVHGDMLDVLASMSDAYVDSVVTDPPYGLAFMGKRWDHGVPGPDYWTACLRVLRPGGHLLAFGGTRTAHRLTVAIEDAGFEIRDTITWLYGSGFPKSHAVDKAITAMERYGGANSVNVRRARLGKDYAPSGRAGNVDGGYGTGTDNPLWSDPTRHVETELTENGARWSGWGTALKPASEPIIVARKPLTGTVAATVLAHGTGALNIDGCRVEGPPSGLKPYVRGTTSAVYNGTDGGLDKRLDAGAQVTYTDHPAGRWPTNVVFSHAPECNGACVDGCPVAELDAQSGITISTGGKGERSGKFDDGWGGRSGDYKGQNAGGLGDSGGASRFYPTFRYQAKAPTRERPKVDGISHPTVKPLALMRWLVRLVTPPGGLVLDPFAGSGTTGEAAVLEGVRAILVERDASYLPLIEARLGRAA